jgi:FtsH-binding integral membrane protein
MVDTMAILAALVGAALFFGAWREYAADNRRDATLLAAFGAALAGAAAWLA